MEEPGPRQVREGALKEARARDDDLDSATVESQYSLPDRLIRAHLRQSIRKPILMTCVWSLSYLLIFA